MSTDFSCLPSKGQENDLLGLGAGDTNTYQAMDGNPETYVDPTGLFSGAGAGGGALSGAAVGAGVGALVGSCVPIVGTAIGAVAGGIAGGIFGAIGGGCYSEDVAASGSAGDQFCAGLGIGVAAGVVGGVVGPLAYAGFVGGTAGLYVAGTEMSLAAPYIASQIFLYSGSTAMGALGIGLANEAIGAEERRIWGAESPTTQGIRQLASTVLNSAANVAALTMPFAGSPNPNAPVSTQSTLTGAAGRARTTMGPGSGPVYGTRVHSAFEAEVNALGNANLHTEVSYLNGQVVPRGTAGSVRLDVVVGIHARKKGLRQASLGKGDEM